MIIFPDYDLKTSDFHGFGSIDTHVRIERDGRFYLIPVHKSFFYGISEKTRKPIDTEGKHEVILSVLKVFIRDCYMIQHLFVIDPKMIVLEHGTPSYIIDRNEITEAERLKPYTR